MRRSTLFEDHIIRYLPESVCEQILKQVRWARGMLCPNCRQRGFQEFLRGKDGQRKVFQCLNCKRQFSTTSGTLFHRSHLPLSKWFVAIYLLIRAKRSINTRELQSFLRTTYKTAWRMRRQISDLFKEQQEYLQQLATDEAGESLTDRREEPNLDAVATQFEGRVPYFVRKLLEQEPF